MHRALDRELGEGRHTAADGAQLLLGAAGERRGGGGKDVDLFAQRLHQLLDERARLRDARVAGRAEKLDHQLHAIGAPVEPPRAGEAVNGGLCDRELLVDRAHLRSQGEGRCMREASSAIGWATEGLELLGSRQPTA